VKVAVTCTSPAAVVLLSAAVKVCTLPLALVMDTDLFTNPVIAVSTSSAVTSVTVGDKLGGELDGAPVGTRVPAREGDSVGGGVPAREGDSVGGGVPAREGDSVGGGVPAREGDSVGGGVLIGLPVGDLIG